MCRNAFSPLGGYPVAMPTNKLTNKQKNNMKTFGTKIDISSVNE